jgi:4'-phosphopantetheinyl transferase EntD
VTSGASVASALRDPLLQSARAPASAHPSAQLGRHMMQELMPPGAVSAEAWQDDGSALLYLEERAQLGNAVESRLQEFATARSLARLALERLGVPPAPIRRGSAREPVWPSGIVGSITHCAGYRAAAVAWSTQLHALGVDAEIDEALPPEIVGSILVAEETAWIENAQGRLHWDRVLFSAKESVYKAWYPLMHRWLDFSQVAITIDEAAGAFRVRPLGSLPEDSAVLLQRLSGRFLLGNGIVLTAVFLTEEPSLISSRSV